MATAQLPAGRSRLADDAATAALYVTHPERKTSISNPPANNTQYFNPRAVGGTPSLSHASAASALAHANHKPVEIWRPPNRQPAAEKAALRVKDFTPPQIPQPTSQYSAEGLGAAKIAVREQRASVGQAEAANLESRRSSVDRFHHTAVGGNPQDKALMAATGAYTSSRKRADSAPSDAGVAPISPHARSAAGASRYGRVEEEGPLDHLDPAMEASRIQHTLHTNAKMYTSTPPIQSEVEEQNNRNSMRAAAISMAKDMYKVTGNETPPTPSGVDPAILAAQHGQSQLGYRKTVSAADGSAVRRAIALQEAAQKRANEKLARMQDENVEYQQYYGTAPQPQPQRLRLVGRRKRTSSDADGSQIDAEQSRQIRSQMTSLRTKMDQVDSKRTRDRELLMQAARRNVDQTIQDMEARVYADTGRAPPSVQSQWDEVARERVRREAESLETASTQGNRVNIGGQKYMDMADVDAIARERLQPSLDEITENAELRRAQELEARLDAEEQQRRADVERQREAEVRELEKQESKGWLPYLFFHGEHLTHELGTGKRERKSESKLPKLFLWAKKGKRDRADKSEADTTQSALPVAQEPTEDQATATATDNDVSRDTIPEEASKEESIEESPQAETANTETPVAAAVSAPEAANTETPVAAVVSAPEVETPKPVEDNVPAAIPRRPTRRQTDPQVEQRESIIDSGPTPVRYFTPPVTSPRADSKLKTWFRDRLVRRSSGPVPVYPHQPGPDYSSDSEPAFQGGAALNRDESRSAALSSHPLESNGPTQTHNRSSSYYSNDLDVNHDNAGESVQESAKQNGNGRKRDRFRKTFLRTVSRSSDEDMPNGDSRRNSTVPSFSKDTAGTDKNSLRESAADQGLPLPPNLGETMNTKRESRFSEDL
ncbi:Eisosome protein 1 [Penicillium bovifimosum]|uniref:Eisosome protein 1 n=1 Tax=Penicillium bovifimosum TaxID=126998 RepID=A0A9W9L0U8_9EURO|nr:Eisosome protein 1 [Penicillium bovifimosum]KAJ5130130.1 Eisosome protein 1 [Penicillium bovifimosum]